MPTINPSVSKMLIDASRVDGRVSLALAEIATRLETNLPDLINAVNEKEEYTIDTEIRLPQFYRTGPIDISEEPLNGILLAATKTTEIIGVRNFRSRYEIVIYSVDEAMETDSQYLRHLDRIALIEVVMYQFLDGCINADERLCWRTLTPSQTEYLPEGWANYNGFAVNYTMTCDPSLNVWPQEEI